jgi:diguanylate cyclase (GGDEF)-like protein
MNDLRKRSALGILFYLVVPYCVFLTDGYIHRHPQFSFFALGVFSVICMCRIVHLFISGTAADRYFVINRRIFYGSVVLTALVWGVIASLMLVQENEQRVQLLVTICTAGFSSGGVISFLPERRLSILYNILMLLPAAAIILAQGESLTLGVALLLYSFYLVLISLQGNAEYWTALENEFLLKRRSEELRQASRTDSLTGLCNRRHFDELLHLTFGLCARRGSQIALIMCDVDHFKNINDTQGHLAGDEYLRFIAQQLKDIFKRDTDVIGRYGGEEFVILLPDEAPASARMLAEMLRSRIAGSFLEYSGSTIRSTVSLGVVTGIPTAGDRPELFIERADSALYRAKNGGRNQVVVYGEEANLQLE